LGVWVKIHMKFHKPKYGCENGFGICFEVTAGIDGPITNDRNLCPVNAEINELNQLILVVTEADLVSYENSSTLPYFRDKTSITLDEPFTFSPETTKRLGATKQITIKAGTYSVQFSDKSYRITIQL
jgi:hypothetical protein